MIERFAGGCDGSVDVFGSGGVDGRYLGFVGGVYRGELGVLARGGPFIVDEEAWMIS